MPENADDFGGNISKELTERPQRCSDAKRDDSCENETTSRGKVLRSCRAGKSTRGQIKTKDDGSGFARSIPIKTNLAPKRHSATKTSESSLENVSNVQSKNEPLEQTSKDAAKSSSLKQFDLSSKSSLKNSRHAGRDKQSSKLVQKKHMLRSSAGSERALRSKVQETPKEPESSKSMANVNAVVAEKRGRRKKGGKDRVIVSDEYTRIKKRLRYFLHRIHYEQNLIDAYSSEGWKGSSLEKLRPEKELQRATSEILRRKLKIRDLFQHLDSLCTEGQFPTSVFDSDGQIDSEDIFCAKCGSKELPTDNDIILCDGACDRGFHQFCLEPPLLSKDIPPDDEGWLCPGCDCKVDCIDLLNDSHGTELIVSDSWEKVFADEAAAAARDGKEPENNLDGPSDDSDDDDDYDPNATETVEKAEVEESSSDESDYSSNSDEHEALTKDGKNSELSSDDSEDDDFDPSAIDANESEKPMETSHQHKQTVGLSSDDSEDDDYDPDALDVDDNVKQESSSSDFSSDSEDLEFAKPRPDKKSKRGKNKSSSEDELLGILDLEPGQGGSSPITAKRQVERLDYKKLNEETYGNLPSESSDDEDYGTSEPRKRKKSTGSASSGLPNGNSSSIKNKAATKGENYGQDDNLHTPQKKTRQNSTAEDTNHSPGKTLKCSPSSGSNGGKAKLSSNRRLGEAVTQRLYESFKENQYPDRITKENLAQELGINPQQVSKWFGNMRWSYRHPMGREKGTTGNAPKKETDLSLQANEILVETEQSAKIDNPTCNGTQNAESPKTSPEKQETAEPSSGQKSTPSKSGRKRSRASSVKPETPATVITPETGVRTRGQRRNSVS